MRRKPREQETRGGADGCLQGDPLSDPWGEASADQKMFPRGEEKLQWLFANMSEGFALHRIVLDHQGRPCDYVFLEMNAAFERLTGLSAGEAIGKRVTQLLHGIEKDPADWIGRYGRVALTGAPVQFESYAVPLGKWFSVSAFCPRPSYFAVTFRDVTEERRSKQALADSEAKYRKLFESLTEEVHYWQLVRDESGQIKTWRLIDANPPALKTWGRGSIEEIRGRTTDEIFGPGATEHYLPVVQKIMAEGVPHSFEDYFPALDRTFRFTSIPLGDRFITTGADISAVKKVARLYEVLSRVNESIVRTHDERHLFEQVCRILAEVGGFPLAWIGLVQGRDIVPSASAGTAAGYLDAIRVQVDGELGQGPTGTAIREEHSVVNYDFDENPMTAAWRSPALAHGFRASAAFPLRRQGKVIGALTLYAARPNAFDAQQVKLLDSLCADISYALDALMQERLRAEAEAALRQSEQRFRLALRNAPVSVAVQDSDFKYIWAFNQRTASSADIIGHSDYEIFKPEEAARVTAIKRRVLEEGIELREQMWLERPSGRMFLDITWEPMRDQTGRVVGVSSATVDLTATKLAEEAVRRSENQLRALIENLNAGVAFIDGTGRFSQYNRQFLKLFGLAPDADVLNVNNQDWSAWRVFDETGGLLHVDEHPVRKAALSGRAVRDQLVGVRVPRGQEVTWMLVSAEPLFDAEGRLEGVICTYSDITERKRVEEALRASEMRYRALHESLRDGFVMVTMDGRIAEFNDIYCQMLGYSAEELRTLTYQDLTPEPWHAEEAKIVREQIIPRGYSDVYEKEYRRKDGTTLPIELRTILSRDDAGRPIAMWGIVRDISERKQAEAALRATLQRFYGMLSAMQCAVLLVSDDDRVEFANPYFCQLFGLKDSPAQLVGVTAAEMLSKIQQGHLHPENEIKRIREILAAGKPVVEEVLALRRATVLRHFIPLNFNGQSCGRLWVHFDITAQKRAEEALREVDRRKNDFLAVLSHELRNPLAPITNSLYILDRAPPAGEQASRAKQVIARQVAHLSSLVNDLLDVTRISRNKIRLSKERLELNELVRRAVEDNRSLFEKGEVRLELEAASRPLHVLADRTRVVQVIGNLLQNAAKFTPKDGSTRVSLSVEGSTAVVRVLDDGVGMVPETLSRLFQPFMQVDQTLDRSKGGLGLGLALVKGLVELHGGSVAASSEGLGQGAEFVVRLPLDTGAALEMTSSLQVREQARRRVLIIEDNHDAADSLREVLELGEHEVEVAYNGPDGISKAGVFKPDLILCDIGLPVMDGYEVARALRSDDRFKRTFLVALSGYALAEDLQRAAEAGFDRHLPKPPAIDKLEELLEGIPGCARAMPGHGSSPLRRLDKADVEL